MEATLYTFLSGTLAFAFAAFTASGGAEQDGSVSKPTPRSLDSGSSAIDRFLRGQTSHDSAESLAGELCQLIHSEFDCDCVAHLTLQHNSLCLSHAVGFVPADHARCNIGLTPDLTRQLFKHPLPGGLCDIEPYLPGEVHQCLAEIGFVRYLPVAWQGRVYGLYFMKHRDETRASKVATLLSALASVVAAAYRLESVEERVTELESRVGGETKSQATGETSELLHPLRVLRLVRHHDSEVLVGHIIEEVQRDLSLEKYTFVYESRRPDEPVRSYNAGLSSPPQLPSPGEFQDLLQAMRHHDPETAIELQSSSDLASPLSDRFRRAGLKYAVAFPVSRTRSAILAWDDAKAPQTVIQVLRRHRHSFKELMENAESFERVEELSYKDNLTGLANRRYFNRRLVEEIGRAKRYHRSLGLIMLDLDELKSINDSYGHQAGDEVLRQLGKILRSSIRAIDVTARYGGDEFCIIMPESDRITCLRFMNRLKHKIVGSKFSMRQLGKDLMCTISQGGAVFPENGATSDQLIFAADMALLQSKDKGRNQYHVFER